MSTALYPKAPHCFQYVAWTPMTCDPRQKCSNKSRDVVGTGRPIHKDPTPKNKRVEPVRPFGRRLHPIIQHKELMVYRPHNNPQI
ncbi:hypothetical protein VZT92_020374 [Zoarces viviparus]|uniref:Uncharacterized protein n=1 Tax=Zoarces viviparus TaxID=48416 RepID=A0AAW1EEU5_ZOAVI